MGKEQDYLLETLQHAAIEKGISLDVLLNQIETTIELVNKPLPPEDRLRYTEELIKEGTIDKDQAALILRKNPLLEAEVRELVEEAKEVIEGAFGLEIDDYDIVFDERLNRTGLAVDFVDPINRIVTLPSEGSIFTPVVIGHILGHIFQNENSKVAQELRSAYEGGGVEAYNQKFRGARLVIEGWAVFLSRQYAHVRDAALGQSFYASIEEELRGWIGINRYMKTKEKLNEYEEGYDLYRQIYERDGIMGTIWAARFIGNNEELRAYVVDGKFPSS